MLMSSVRDLARTGFRVWRDRDRFGKTAACALARRSEGGCGKETDGGS